MNNKRVEIIVDADNIDECLALAEQYDAVFEYQEFFMSDFVDDYGLCEKRIEFYKSLPRNREMDTLHGAFMDLCPGSTDPLIAMISKLRMKQSMTIAEQLGVRGVVFHSGTIADFKIPNYVEMWKEKTSSFIRQLLDTYPKLEIYYENMFDKDPELLTILAQELKDEPRFGICYDVAHGNLGRVSQQEWFTNLAPYIKHMHVNDNNGINDSHSAVGTGSIDWNEYSCLVDKLGVDASVLVEVTPHESKEQSLKYMRENKVYPFN